MNYGSWHAMRSFSRDSSITQQRIKPGTIRRIMSYARPYRRELGLCLVIVALVAAITVAVPLLLRGLIDNGILPRDKGVVLAIGAAVIGLALFDAMLSIGQRWYSARIGEGLIYDLRTEVFAHVQRQPIAFFTRTQTGSLVSRLNSDVIGAQQALTSTLSSVVANVLSLALVLGAMLLLSCQVTLVALWLIPALSSLDGVWGVHAPKPLSTAARAAVGVETRRAAPAIDFDEVSFRYPTASEISLASLESIALPVPEHTDANAEVLRRI